MPFSLLTLPQGSDVGDLYTSTVMVNLTLNNEFAAMEITFDSRYDWTPA
jgi:hypothetical protein